MKVVKKQSAAGWVLDASHEDLPPRGKEPLHVLNDYPTQPMKGWQPHFDFKNEKVEVTV